MNRKFSNCRRRQALPCCRWAMLALAMLPCGQASAFGQGAFRQGGSGHSGSGQRWSAPVAATTHAAGAAVLLEQAVVRLTRQPSVAANLRQRIDLYGKQLVGSGSYRQLNTGKDLLFRTELKVPVGDTISSLLQVCDGRFLWTYRTLPHEQSQHGLQTTLTHVDLNEVRKRTADNGITLMQPIGYGGLPGLLSQSLQLFEFSAAKQGVLHDVPVWLLVGSWRTEISQLWLGTDDSDQPRKRPPHVPDMIALALGVDDLFPYRIEYRVLTSPSDSSSGAKSIMVSEDNARPMMTLELFEVQTGQTIDPQMFYYRPTDVQSDDATDTFIRNHTVNRQLTRR